MKLKLSDYGYTILMIETKLVCNMRCGFCAYPLMDSIGTELPEEDVHRVIDSIDPSDSALEAIYFQKFNEPLLDKRIFGFVRYAMDRGFRVQMITNGLPLGSPEIRRKLLDAAPTNILISLQVIDRDSFNQARGISSSFEEYKKGIFTFLQESLERDSSSRITIDVACNFLSSDQFFSKTGGITKILGLDRGDPSVPDTVQEIRDDLIAFLRDLHAFNPAFAFDEQEVRNYLNTIDPNYLRQPGLPVSGNISVKVKQFIHGRKLTDFYPVKNAPGCETGMLSVDAGGSVTPCCLAYGKMLSLGNIKKDSLKEILDRTKPLVAGIRTGKKLPAICMRCHGEPTKRGSIVASVYWALNRRLS